MPYRDPEKAKAWRAANAEKLREAKARHYAENAEQYKDRARAGRLKDVEGCRAKKRAAYATKVGGLREPRTAEQLKTVRLDCDRAKRTAKPEKYRAHKAAYKNRNPAKVRAATAGRRARKLSATPGWANSFFIEQAYDIARIRTRMTGVEWHVDHVVPLRSRIVCGLHVDGNLRVVPARENMLKGNRHWPDMP